MYEDEPQDRVHDVLSEAVYGDHPLGRRVLGEADGDRACPARRSPPTTTTATRRRTSSSRPPATSTTPRSPSSPAKHLARGPPSERRARPAADRRAPRLCFQRKETEQYHICFGGQGISRGDDRRFALGASTRSSAARAPHGCSRDPREARARLRRRLLRRAVRRPRHGRHVRRHPRGERRRGLRDHRPRARGLRAGASPRRS